ncbi:MAG: WYL domain-containing protein [Burkholderiaceae bacterium]
MNQTERLYRIDQLISQRGVVAFTDMMAALEVSRATLKRDLAYLRDRLNAPILYDRDAGGYRFEQAGSGPQYELPGLWFSDREILALLTMHKMLKDLDSGGLLGGQIDPLIKRLNSLLGTASGSPEEILQRVRVVPSLNRPVPPRFFERVGQALVGRQRLELDYGPAPGMPTWRRREVSPQRLVHYRNAWYLDAWCRHRSEEPARSVALDAIQEASVLGGQPGRSPRDDRTEHRAPGYVIFRGTDIDWALCPVRR